MVGLDSKRFVLVTGKGGVGKTTVSAAMAVHLASRGLRVLVAMCNAKERLSTLLGSGPIGSDILAVSTRRDAGHGAGAESPSVYPPASVRPGAVPWSGDIWAVNMDPERAIEEYGLLTLRSKALYKVLFDNKYVRTFLRAVPGLHEWAMLGKAWWHTTELLPDGRPKYDVVVLDAPATGHGLDMLRVPKVISEIVPPGILRRDADRALELFRDQSKTAVVLVTLPEEMPVTETIELAGALRDELSLPIGRVVVNGVLPPLFSRGEREVLANLGAFTPVVPGEAALLSGRNRATRERIQAESLARLSKELPVSPSFLPLLFENAATPHAIFELSRRV